MHDNSHISTSIKYILLTQSIVLQETQIKVSHATYDNNRVMKMRWNSSVSIVTRLG